MSINSWQRCTEVHKSFTKGGVLCCFPVYSKKRHPAGPDHVVKTNGPRHLSESSDYFRSGKSNELLST